MISDAPWIGLCKEDWENRTAEIIGYCECCGEPIKENEDYKNDCGTLLCSNCLEENDA